MKLDDLNTFQNNSYETIDDEIKHASNMLKAVNKEYTTVKPILDVLNLQYYEKYFARPDTNTVYWTKSQEYKDLHNSKEYKKTVRLNSSSQTLEARLKTLKYYKKKGVPPLTYPRIW
jgi:hypothetical protein